MLKKLMSSIVIGSIVLSMAGCTTTNENDKQQAQDIINSTKQERQVQPKEEEVKKEQEQPKEQLKEQSKKQTKEESKEQPKEQPKQEQQSKPKESKKKQNDNIDTDTGLAKVKDGTHLGEEADKQDKQIKQEEDDSVWTEDYCPECGKPSFNCICDGDTDADIDDSTTTIYEHKNVVPDELQGDDYKEPECPDCGQPLSKCPFDGGHTTVEE